jgi:hypothetical protein
MALSLLPPLGGSSCVGGFGDGVNSSLLFSSTHPSIVIPFSLPLPFSIPSPPPPLLRFPPCSRPATSCLTPLAISPPTFSLSPLLLPCVGLVGGMSAAGHCHQSSLIWSSLIRPSSLIWSSLYGRAAPMLWALRRRRQSWCGRRRQNGLL